MKKIKECEHCVIKGYSVEFCKFHRKRINAGTHKGCFMEKYSKTALVGAGTGVATVTLGFAVLPAATIKAFLANLLAVKLMAGAGAGATGAAYSLIFKHKNNSMQKKDLEWYDIPEPKTLKKRRLVI